MPKPPKYPEAFLALCHSVTAKRPKTVIEHILKHGQITTEELKNIYGYNHPPRAARDVKEHGIPVERVTVTGSDGRKIAAYRFGDPAVVKVRRFDGRTGLSKQIRHGDSRLREGRAAEGAPRIAQTSALLPCVW